MKKLNLPAVNVPVRNKDGKHYLHDVIRKKDLLFTPEEWVRQNFLHFMIDYLRVPRGLIRIESGLKAGKREKRTDILVYSQAVKPLYLVECKADYVPVNAKTMDQVINYNRELHAHCLILTNGMNHYCCVKSPGKGAYSSVSEIPLYTELNPA